MNLTLKTSTRTDSRTIFTEDEQQHIRKVQLLTKALSHPLKKRIIDLLDIHKEMTVTDIYINLRLEQSVASQHLAALRRCKLVLTERQGKFIYYRLNWEKIYAVKEGLPHMMD